MRRTALFALGTIALSLFFLCPICSVQGQDIVINESNLMKQVGHVPDNFIVSAIGMAKRIDIDDPKSLSGKGVSQTVIDALMKRKAELAFSAEPNTPSPATGPAALQNAPQAGSKACPSSDGVYFNSPSSGWVSMEAAPMGQVSSNYGVYS